MHILYLTEGRRLSDIDKCLRLGVSYPCQEVVPRGGDSNNQNCSPSNVFALESRVSVLKVGDMACVGTEWGWTWHVSVRSGGDVT